MTPIGNPASSCMSGIEVEDHGEWIRAKDRLPPLWEDVVVRWRSEKSSTGWGLGIGWMGDSSGKPTWHIEGRTPEDIYAWTPIPKFREEEDNERVDKC